MMFLQRLESSDDGTFGRLWVADFSVNTLELPWRRNNVAISCIPAGSYKVRHWSSSKYLKAFHITPVLGRTDILVHQGNWAGDTTRGFRSNSNGCILVGSARAVVNGQRGIINSVITLHKLVELFADITEWSLEIRDVN